MPSSTFYLACAKFYLVQSLPQSIEIVALQENMKYNATEKTLKIQKFCCKFFETYHEQHDLFFSASSVDLDGEPDKLCEPSSSIFVM